MTPYPKPEKKPKVIPVATYREKYLSKTRKKKKYRNKSQVYTTTLYGSRTFDSIKEANYAEELDYRLMAGEIKHYELQPKIDIRINGKHICNYFCDFKVIDNDGQVEYHKDTPIKELIEWARDCSGRLTITIDEMDSDKIIIILNFFL